MEMVYQQNITFTVFLDGFCVFVNAIREVVRRTLVSQLIKINAIRIFIYDRNCIRKNRWCYVVISLNLISKFILRFRTDLAAIDSLSRHSEQKDCFIMLDYRSILLLFIKSNNNVRESN